MPQVANGFRRLVMHIGQQLYIATDQKVGGGRLLKMRGQLLTKFGCSRQPSHQSLESTKPMTPEQTLRAAIEAAAVSYQGALQTFSPWPTASYRRNRVIKERNLSFHFARAFTICVGQSVAFMEQQFVDPTQLTPRKQHLDVYVASPVIAVAMEAKTFFDTTEAPGVLLDFHRVTCGSAQQQRTRHPTLQPAEVRGLVLVETWKPIVRSWWNLGGRSPDAFRFDSVRTVELDSYRTAGWTFLELRIECFNHLNAPYDEQTNTCWWLCAYSPPL